MNDDNIDQEAREKAYQELLAFRKEVEEAITYLDNIIDTHGFGPKVQNAIITLMKNIQFLEIVVKEQNKKIDGGYNDET